jgi:hypothetical protein
VCLIGCQCEPDRQAIGKLERAFQRLAPDSRFLKPGFCLNDAAIVEFRSPPATLLT